MDTQETKMTVTRQELALNYDLGTFEGFNFRANGAIDRTLTAEEVVNWDHDAHGEAEFWPSGDHPAVACLFSRRSSVTGQELVGLDCLLEELGGDSTYNFLRVYYAVQTLGYDLDGLTGEQVEDQPLHIFEGNSFLDLRKQAAFELFELYYPDEYRVWEKSLCDGLIFDEARFLDSPAWSVEEVHLGDTKALLVASN
jgi:hypothetical protein